MPTHPGGEGLILEKAGQDATVAFREAKHSMDAIEKKESFLIGTVKIEPKKLPSLVQIALFIAIVLAAVWFFVGSIA